MARTLIDHSCKGCGLVRRVSPDKLARGIQHYCRKCQGPRHAEQRRISMLNRGRPLAASAHSEQYLLAKRLNRLWRAPRRAE